MPERVILRVDRQGPLVLFVEQPGDMYGRRCQSNRGTVDVKEAIHNSRSCSVTHLGSYLVIQRDTPGTRKVRLAMGYVEAMPPVAAGYETPNKQSI